MVLLSVLGLAVALSMDAFAVAVGKGLASRKVTCRNMLTVGLWFGGFQALMPIVGYFLANSFKKYIETYIPWIAFILLLLIGLNMIRETIWGGDEEVNASFGFKTMFVMAIATSIDAMAAGITILAWDFNIFIAAGIIGIITFLLSAFGVKVGNLFGSKCQKGAEIAGGAVLILMAIKFLVEIIISYTKIAA